MSPGSAWLKRFKHPPGLGLLRFPPATWNHFGSKCLIDLRLIRSRGLTRLKAVFYGQKPTYRLP
jgi:hypothetical protein